MRRIPIIRTLAALVVVSLPVGSANAASYSLVAQAQSNTGKFQSSRAPESPRALSNRQSGFAELNTASTGSIVVSGSGGVFVYSDTLKVVAEIAGISNPEGLALDASGDLYISHFGTNGIPVYKNDYKTQIATLMDSFNTTGVAVDRTGVVAAIDYTSSAPGHVTFFANGSSTPCTALSLPNVSQLFQGTFDGSGNLYVTGETQNNVSFVGVISGGCSAAALTILSTTNTFGRAWGIQVSRFGKIAVLDQYNRTLYTYNPPRNGALGTPIASTGLTSVAVLWQFAFTAKSAFIFAAEYGGDAVVKYAYPTGGNPLQTFGSKQMIQPFGLVITSAEQP